MSLAFVFPGQGAQTIGMGRDLAEAYPAAQAVVDEVDEALGEKLSALIWEGEAETPVRMDVFAPGLYFPHPVEISVVEDGVSRPLRFDLDVFDKTDKFPDLPIDDTLG